MALVFPHEGPYVDGAIKFVIGKFLGDGSEYLACVRDKRFIDFYLFPECYIKYKTIEVLEKDSGYSIDQAELYNMSPTLDYVVLHCSYNNRNSSESLCKCWNATEIINLDGGNRPMRFPATNVAPGLFIYNKNQVRRMNDVVFSREVSDESNIFIKLLDENTIVIHYGVENVHKLEIWSLKTNQVVSNWTFDQGIPSEYCFYSYISRDDRSKIIFGDSYSGDDDDETMDVRVLDISHPEAVNITDRFNVLMGNLQKSKYGKFVSYDYATGFPVFCFSQSDSKQLVVFNVEGYSSLDIDNSMYFLSEKYFLFNSNVYEITLNPANELAAVYETHLTIPMMTEHTYRDLAGTVYLDVNGVFRESLAFATRGVLSSESVEPVTNIFWVGKDSVLLSGKTKGVVVDTKTAEEVDSWYRPEETLFACDDFQVYKAQGKPWLCTKDNQIELPFVDASLFASSDNGIVVGSTTKIVIVEPNLEVSQTIEDSSIVAVFSEGYVCKSGVKLFKTPGRNVQANNIVSAQLVNDVLFTVSYNGELRSGVNQERVDLMLEGVDFIETFNDKLLISGFNDTYVYSKGEYTSIDAGDYESILISDDNQVCITLIHGIVYFKTNFGFRLVKKKVGGFRDYRQVSVSNDKLMCYQEIFDSHNNVVVKYIHGNVTNRFRKPNKIYREIPATFWSEATTKIFKCDLMLLSETHFLEFGACAEFSVSTLQNPEVKVYEDTAEPPYPITEYFDVRWSTRPCLESDNKFYASSQDCTYVCEAFELVNGACSSFGVQVHVDCMTSPAEGEDHYTLGLQPANYPRSGDHWIVYERLEEEDRKWGIQLIPKSEKSIMLDVGFVITPLMSRLADSVSCIRSAEDSDVYYCASVDEVYKVSVDGTQETIATLKYDYDFGYYGPFGHSPSTKYTVNHGSKIKYEPDFIITHQGFPTTITILPPSEAEKLQAVQKELIGDSKDANVVSEIDGRFLLTAAMDSKNEYFFTKHGIDIDELRKDLFELFK